MKKLLFVALVGLIFLLVALFLINKSDSSLFTSEYTLTLVTYPGDRIDLYEYVDGIGSHQGREIFYLKAVDEKGKISIKLPKGKYAVWARCLEMSCQRSFDGPKIIILDKNKVIKLNWVPEY